MREFKAEELGRSVQLWRAAAGEPVFSLAALEDVMWAAGPQHLHRFALCAPGRRESLPRRAGASLLHWARDGLQRGLSLAAVGLEDQVPALARLAQQLGQQVDARIAVSAVLTPRQASGFAPHVDADDVIVLLLEGRKRWQVGRRTLERPAHHRELDDAAFAATAPLDDELGPGDMLYLPAGTPHRAFTRDEPTLQLTLSVEPYRWLDLLGDLVDMLAEDDLALRRRDAGGSGVQDAAAPELPALLAVLAERAPDLLERAAAHRLRREMAGARTLPGRLLREPPSWSDGLRVARPPGQRCQVRPLTAGASLDFAGPTVGSLVVPAVLAAALRFVATRDGPFAAEELPDLLSFDEKRQIVQRLLAEGGLEVAA